MSISQNQQYNITPNWNYAVSSFFRNTPSNRQTIGCNQFFIIWQYHNHPLSRHCNPRSKSLETFSDSTFNVVERQQFPQTLERSEEMWLPWWRDVWLPWWHDVCTTCSALCFLCFIATITDEKRAFILRFLLLTSPHFLSTEMKIMIVLLLITRSTSKRL